MYGRPHYVPEHKLTSYQIDRKRGVNAEHKFKQIMQHNYGLTLKPTDRFCFYDFESEKYNVLFELKRRNINHNRYKTTLITYDKIQRFDALNDKNGGKYRFILVFYYNDGIYYFEHRRGYKYTVEKYKRNDRHDMRDKAKDYAFIPITELNPLSNIMNTIKSKLIVAYNT